MIYVTLFGNLGGDAEEKHTKEGGKFYAFNVAVDLAPDRKQWVACSLSGQPKNYANLKRGAQVAVLGTFSKVYVGKSGDASLQVRAQNVRILRHARDDAAPEGGTGLYQHMEKRRETPAVQQYQPPQAQNVHDFPSEHDDLPF